MITARRHSLVGLGVAVAASTGLNRTAPDLIPHGAKTLESLQAHLAKAPGAVGMARAGFAYCR